jgi:hypothetical protein
VAYQSGGAWIANDGSSYATQDEAEAADAAFERMHAAAVKPLSQDELTAQTHDAALNNQKMVRQPDGSFSLVPMTPEETAQNQSQLTNQALTQTNTAMTAPPATQVNRSDPAAGLVRPGQQPTMTQLQNQTPLPGAIPSSDTMTAAFRPPTHAAPRAGTDVMTQTFGGQRTPETPTNPAAAPKLDTSKLDELLNGVNSYASQIAAMAGDNTGLSEGLAQLQRGLEATRSQALSLARSGSSRDRAALTHQAVAEGTAAASQASMDAALLRSQEEQADRQFKLDALKEASSLGLNTSALELDVSKVNLDSVMNIVNQNFQQLGIDKQISQQEAESLRNYARDMSALQFQYDSLSSDEQKFISEQIMKKYGIDQELANNLEVARISKPKQRPWWQDALVGAVGGGVAGIAGAATKAIV